MAILNRELENHKIKSISGSMLVTNLYTAGIGNEIFLRGLKDQEKILGSFCSKCKKTFLPARLFCERCLTRLSDHRPAPEKGLLQSFTKVYVDLDDKPLEEPKMIGFITFKGFEGGLIHQIECKNEKKLKIGSKAKPVFHLQNQRKGSILDITHFEIF